MPFSNWLTEEQIQELLGSYVEGALKEDDWPSELKRNVESLRKEIFNSETLNTISDVKLSEELIKTYRSVVRVPLYYKAIEKNVKLLHSALSYLLSSNDSIIVKINNLLTTGGIFFIKGLGKSFWSIFFMALNPDKNPNWNNKTEIALDKMGLANWNKSEPPGEIYEKISIAELELVKRKPALDLYTVDHFMHYVTVLDGKKIIDEWKGTSIPDDDWSKKIAYWREKHLTPDRIAARKEAEAEARDLIETNLGRFDKDLSSRFFDLLNTDYYSGKTRRDRFGLLIINNMAKQVEAQLEKFNELTIKMWQAPDSAIASLLDEYWKENYVSGAGRFLPTALLYIRDRDRYNVWFKTLAKGLKQISGLNIGDRGGTQYLEYNSKVNEIKQKYNLEPQEIDAILTLADRESPEKPHLKNFHGFDKDTFIFLEELTKNNNSEWMNSNTERYKKVLREPLRLLFQDIAPSIASLNPELETEAKFGKVLAGIKKRWPDEAGPYHTHLWGAFYRAKLTKQTDAQLYIILFPEMLCVGIGSGSDAKDTLTQFRKNIKQHASIYFDLLNPLLKNGAHVTTLKKSGDDERVILDIKSIEDLKIMEDLDHIEIEYEYGPHDEILYKSEFSILASNLFKSMYPLYRFFIEDITGTLPEKPAEDEIDDIPIEQLKEETFLDTDYLNILETLLMDKRQIVLYGPPGTGKTYVAKKFARYFINKTGGEIKVIQFHPSYSYEEFIEGIRPKSDGKQITYPIEKGIFRIFCEEARLKTNGERYVLIIDEINRGNLPRIFGELLYLLEYRNDSDPTILPYSQDRFSIPENIYIIGTMNTADRSIALIDHALRRRFHFSQLRPNPEILRQFLIQGEQEQMAWLADLLDEVNKRLEQDNIDWHLQIGHSHWMISALDEEKAKLIWDHSVLPTLEEYFYNRSDRLRRYDYDSIKEVVKTSVF